jgi:hypothetical protein
LAADYYNILGVPPNADTKRIKAAYRQLARLYHPDVNPGDLRAEEKFKDVANAYYVLNDGARRARYDAKRVQWADDAPSQPPRRQTSTGNGASNATDTPLKRDHGFWQRDTWESHARRAAQAARTATACVNHPGEYDTTECAVCHHSFCELCIRWVRRQPVCWDCDHRTRQRTSQEWWAIISILLVTVLVAVLVWSPVAAWLTILKSLHPER